MFKKLSLLLVIFQMIHGVESRTNSPLYQWAVVGAGLAGITVIAVLIEYGIEPSNIIWIDPEFGVGRLGKYYQNVPSNSAVKLLRNYYDSCPVLKHFPSEARQALDQYDPEEYLLLKYAVAPLAEATVYFRSRVTSQQAFVYAIDKHDGQWILSTDSHAIHAHKVVLAIGARPKSLDLGMESIPLDDALDKDKLATYVNPEDTVAVFGGMHSALLVLKNISELSVKRVINFFTTPYYRRVQGAESLEGITKKWVQEVLELYPPSNLIRVKNTQENRNEFLPLCNKVIYAIGFERNQISINGSYQYVCDQKSGIIEKNLYGFGIAFPHEITTYAGKKIAINGFAISTVTAHEFIPLWCSQH